MTSLPTYEARAVPGPYLRSLNAAARERHKRLFGVRPAIEAPQPPAPDPEPKPIVAADPELAEELPAADPCLPTIPPPKWRVILEQTADKYNLTVNAIIGPSRAGAFLPARREAAYRMTVEAGMSYPDAGRRLHRDHTTVLLLVRRHIEAHPELRPAIEEKQQAEHAARVALEERIVDLYFGGGIGPKEIAARLSTTVGVVQGAVHREVVRVREARKVAAE